MRKSEPRTRALRKRLSTYRGRRCYRDGSVTRYTASGACKRCVDAVALAHHRRAAEHRRILNASFPQPLL
jgi:hypothetical protein